MACITSITDYEVLIWWKGQKNLLKRYQNLQNNMLRKALEAFKPFFITVIEIEAFILSVKIRFEKICQNYAYRTLLLNQDHFIRKRAPESFSFSVNEEIKIN
jgi:hypothetical protein